VVGVSVSQRILPGPLKTLLYCIVESSSNLMRLFVGDMSVDDQRVSADRQDVGSHDGNVVPVTVVDRWSRIDDDRPRPVAGVKHVAWSSVHQLH